MTTAPASDTQFHPPYRRDIDGLRALAVLAVLCYHAFPDLVPGGFIGVDVFFVISGFLITSILLGNLAREQFSFRDFYARRIKRIFPALILVLAMCLVLGWIFLLPDEYTALSNHIVAGAGFVSNFRLWSEAGYFDAAGETKPLLHLWSLGIEEQFYILWPLILYGGWKKKGSIPLLIALLLVASFLFNRSQIHQHATADFYSPLTRFWELLFGSLLAYPVFSRKLTFRRPWLRHAQSFLGLIALVLAMAFFTKQTPFPGKAALLPVAGAFLLIAAGPTAWFNRFILASRPLVGIGLISYPLYLWHWPLLTFTRIAEMETPSAEVRIGALLLSAALAYGTYRFLEKPIRFRLKSARTVPTLCLAMLLVALCGIASIALHGVPSRFSAQLYSYINYTYNYNDDARGKICWLGVKDGPESFARECVDAPNGKPVAVVWGDSHAARFFPGFKAYTRGYYRLAQFNRDVCPPILGYVGGKLGYVGDKDYTNCTDGNRYILGQIRALHAHTVILMGLWTAYGKDPALDTLPATISALKEAGVSEIIVMGPMPQWNNTLRSDLIRRALNHHESVMPTRMFDYITPTVKPMDTRLRSMVGSIPSVFYFSGYDAMCNAQGCLTTLTGGADGLTTWDYGHLTTPAALYVAQKLGAATSNFWGIVK